MQSFFALGMERTLASWHACDGTAQPVVCGAIPLSVCSTRDYGDWPRPAGLLAWHTCRHAYIHPYTHLHIGLRQWYTAQN